MKLVCEATWHFTYAKSNLKDLIDKLGGPYYPGWEGKRTPEELHGTMGEDNRTLNRNQLIQVQDCIWPGYKRERTLAWNTTKTKYAAALLYLVGKLFPQVDPADALLVGEYKRNWQPRILAENTKFVTSSGVDEANLNRSHALRPRYARELCIPIGGLVGDWETHKFVFATIRRLDDEGNLKKAAGFGKMGFGSKVYCFQRLAGDTYMSNVDVDEMSGKARPEFGFPDDIALEFIMPHQYGKPKAPTWNASQWIPDPVPEPV